MGSCGSLKASACIPEDPWQDTNRFKGISKQQEMFDNAWRKHCKEKQGIEEEQRDHLLKTIQW